MEGDGVVFGCTVSGLLILGIGFWLTGLGIFAALCLSVSAFVLVVWVLGSRYTEDKW